MSWLHERAASGRWLFSSLTGVLTRLRTKARLIYKLPGRVGYLVDLAEELRQQLQASRAEMLSLRCLVEEQGNLLQSQSHLLELASRLPRAAAAEAAVRSRLPLPPARRGDGVSLLLPRYPTAKLRAAALDLARTALDALPTPGEILIVEEAGRHASGEEGIRVLSGTESLGLTGMRNVLLAQARFRHAVLLDPNDELLPASLPVLYESARQTGAALTYGTVATCDEAGTYRAAHNSQRAARELLAGLWLRTPCLLDAEAVLALGGFDPLLEVWPVWELGLRLLRVGRPLTLVPTVVGRSRACQGAIDANVSVLKRLLWQRESLDGAIEPSALRASVHHPATGYLWRSPEPLGVGIPRQQPPRRARPRFLLVCPAGEGTGANARLLATLQRLQRLRPGCRVLVVSDGAKPPPLGRLGAWAGTTLELARGLHPDLLRQGGVDDPRLIEQLPEAPGAGAFLPADPSDFDAVLFSGGLDDPRDTLLATRVVLAAAVRALGIPFLLTGQEIGPVAADLRPLLAALLRGAARCGVTDEQSASRLREYGVGGVPVEVVGDDGLGLTPRDPGVVRQALARAGVPDGQPLLGFQMGPAVPEAALLATADRADEAAAGLGYAVACLASSAREVERLARLPHCLKHRRASWFLADPGDDPALAAGFVQVCTAVLTDSRHVALLALGARIPALLLAGSDSPERLREAFGLPTSIGVSSTTPARGLIEPLEQLRTRPWSPRTSAQAVEQWWDRALSSPGCQAGPADR